jgi:hypothetical protein
MRPQGSRSRVTSALVAEARRRRCPEQYATHMSCLGWYAEALTGGDATTRATPPMCVRWDERAWIPSERPWYMDSGTSAIVVAVPREHDAEPVHVLETFPPLGRRWWPGCGRAS